MNNNHVTFSLRLLAWYGREHRNLPWRETKDPYRIWLSEVILQQTRVAQGLPYYERILNAFPTVVHLAAASEQQVLRLWQGLGYYSRARNLHHAAKEVTEKFDGTFPKNKAGLLKLKGIGSYTASAIASFAYGEPVAVVDGNVYRVLARVFDLEEDIASTKGQKIFAEFAQAVLPKNESSTYNQAIMEFGAVQCVPKNPDCKVCPMQSICMARQLGKIDILPVKTKKVKIRTRYFQYLIVKKKETIYMQQRGEGDIWQGLYEPPLLETDKAIGAEELADLMDIGVTFVPTLSTTMRHLLTHQRIFAQFFIVDIDADSKIDQYEFMQQSKAYNRELIDVLPKPKLITRFLELHDFV